MSLGSFCAMHKEILRYTHNSRSYKNYREATDIEMESDYLQIVQVINSMNINTTDIS
jgi:hypothetical protein